MQLRLLFLFIFSTVAGFAEWCSHVDLLYWQAREKAFVLTNKPSPIFTTDDFTVNRASHPDFDWDFGVRVGIGYAPPCAGWGTNLEWTFYQTHVDQHKHAHNGEGFFPIWSLSDETIPGDYVTEASLHGNLCMNLLDLEFCAPVCTFSCFELNPYFGVRAAWIRQCASVHYEGGIFLTAILAPGVSLEGEDHIHMYNDFWGVGPRVGISPRIWLCDGFSIYGDATINGLVGQFHVKQRERYLETTRFCRSKHYTRFRWNADFAAGIGWGMPICDCQYDLAFELGWEYHIFFKQFMLKKDAFHVVPTNRDLKVQGVTFSMYLDY